LGGDVSNYTEQFGELGLKRAGAYARGAFSIYEDWRASEVVYVWSQSEGAGLMPLRVGIACGPKGFGRRYDHYNKWLAGRFKPADMREQKVRSLFLQGLGGGATVWAMPVPDKPRAREVEKTLRDFWGSVLSLDLMVRDSWGKREMNAWRAAGRPRPTVIWPPA
jgi:hypothetical protein